MSGTWVWYLSRATGVVSLLLLTLVCVLGATVALKARMPGTPRFVMRSVHRNASLIAVVFLVVHIATAVLDTYVPIDLKDVFVPFVARYEALWVGLGACAVDLMLAVLLTTVVRHRLGQRGWKAVHYLAYAAFPVALLHGLKTGTDLRSGLLLAVTIGCAALVTIAAVTRLAASRRATPRAVRVHEVLATATDERTEARRAAALAGRPPGRW